MKRLVKAYPDVDAKIVKKRSSSMLLKRTITVIILLSLFLWINFALPQRYFEWITGLFFLAAVREWAALAGARHWGWQLLYCLCSGVLLYLSFFIPYLFVYAGALLWWLVATLWVINFPAGTTIWNNAWPLRYLIGFFVLIPCWLAINQVHAFENGPVYTLLLLLIVSAADTGAYFAGRFWGKHPLMPRVSPNKTKEGFYGGILTSFFVGALYAYFFAPTLFYSTLFVCVLIITALFSVLGDLTESMIKRLAGVKDSGVLLPGHGGVLDRIDSWTSAGPIFALLLWFNFNDTWLLF